MLSRIVVCAVVMYVGSPVWADSQLSLNNTMTKIGEEMVQLLPMVIGQTSLGNQQKTQITASTNRLVGLFRQAGPQIKQKSTTYNVSYRLVLDYLERTQNMMGSNRWELAQGRLASLGEICTTCHTQDTKLRTLFPGSERDKFSDDYSYAEFNFYTRNYADAELYYDHYLKSVGHKIDKDIINVFQRLVTIYAQIYNRPGEGAAKLSKHLHLFPEDTNVKKRLVALVFGLQTLEQQGLSKVKEVDDKTLEKYVHRYLGPLDQPASDFLIRPEEEVSRVWLRGLLFHHLNRAPKKTEIPKILYWLAVTDRSLDYNYYYSLADLYLKECVYSYSSHLYAKKCYQEYREYVLFSYTGSAGEFIPEDVEVELDELKSALK